MRTATIRAVSCPVRSQANGCIWPLQELDKVLCTRSMSQIEQHGCAPCSSPSPESLIESSAS